jgi:beta-phosphoglucomutase-like phosphatase (HAD superfamily)
MNSQISTLIFDLDGVLADLCNFHRDTFIKSYNQLCNIKINETFHNKHLEGLSTRTKIKKLKELYPDTLIDEDKIFNLKQSITFEELEKAVFTDRTKIALTWAKENGFKIGILTNSIRHTLDIVIRKLDIANLLDYHMSNEDVPEPKPSSEGYKLLMKNMNIDPKNVIIFEDSVPGLKAAYGSGANVIKIVNSLDLTPSFLSECIKNNTRPTATKLRIVIPMAGLGSRFQKDGYIIQKPFLPMLNGNQMWEEVVENLMPKNPELRRNTEVHLIVRKEQLPFFKTKPNLYVHYVPILTEGAACTVLTLKNIINDDVPLMIGNSDQYLEWDSDEFYSASFHPDYDGGISTFYHPCPDDLKWSYASIGINGIVDNVAEKKYIGPNATTGLYSWKKGSDYVKYAEQMILYNDRVNNEFYVCPVYNYAIKDNKKIRIINCDKFWGIGVPNDYMYFIDNYKNNNLMQKYNGLWCKWGSRLPEYQPDIINDKSLCVAMWCKELFHFNEKLEDLKNALEPWKDKFLWYNTDKNSNTILHNTFFQFRRFSIKDDEKLELIDNINLWTETVKDSLNKLPPYYLHLNGIAPVKNGICLCGYPPTDYTEVKNNIRKTAYCIEPHAQDIHHITLLRWIKPISEDEYKNILNIINLFKNTYFGTLQPTKWFTGFSTWNMKEESLEIIHSWDALPSPWILHRGNNNGLSPNTENKPEILYQRLDEGWDIEIDLWKISEDLYLGHDKPEYKINENEKLLIHPNTWIHCKNLEAYFYLRNHKDSKKFNYFSHDKDEFAVTSKGFIWSNINTNIIGPGSIKVVQSKNYNLMPGVGICTDWTP